MNDINGAGIANQAVETTIGTGTAEATMAQGTEAAAAAETGGDTAAVADAIMADFLRETGGNPDAIGTGANETGMSDGQSQNAGDRQSLDFEFGQALNTGTGRVQNASAEQALDIGFGQTVNPGTGQAQGAVGTGQQVGSAGAAGGSEMAGSGVPGGVSGVGNTDIGVTGNGALSGQNGLETGVFNVTPQAQTGADQYAGARQNEGISNDVQNTQRKENKQGQFQQNAVPQGNNLNGQNAPVQQSQGLQTTQTGQQSPQGQQPQQGDNEQGRQTVSAALPRAVTEAEWKELVEAHPEIVGAKLPDEIFKACVMSERSPLQVYDAMMLKQTQNQLSYLMAENAKLKQDLENFRRAPVVSMAGGAPNAQPKDEILDAFMKYE